MNIFKYWEYHLLEIIIDLIILKENHKKSNKIVSASSTIQKPNVGLSDKVEEMTKCSNINIFHSKPIKFYLTFTKINKSNVQIND